jgi:hypothetical protein
MIEPSQQENCADVGLYALDAGQHYIRVFASDTSYGSNYTLSLNARHEGIDVLIHFGTNLQNLVYRGQYGGFSVDGQDLGPFEWAHREETKQGPFANTVLEISAKADNAFSANSISPVYLPRGTVSVRVIDVRYSFYYSKIANGSVIDRINLYFDTGNPARYPEFDPQPEMWLTFSIDTGECIGFEAPGIDGFDPYYPNVLF